MPGHQTKEQARAFIRAIPGWPWVKLLENFLPSLWWDDDTGTPEDASIIQAELISTLGEGLERWVCAVLPTGGKHRMNFGEGRAASSPRANVFGRHWKGLQHVNRECDLTGGVFLRGCVR